MTSSKMRVLFIVPPEETYIGASAHEILDRKREARPRLGILYVASYLENKRSDISIKLLDCPALNINFDDLSGYIKSFGPAVIGITAVTFTIVDALKAAKISKTVQPNATVVIGGVHVTYYPRETLASENVDVVVIGEGEITFFELINKLEKNSPLSEVLGIAYKDKNGIYVNPSRSEIENLDRFPFPNYDLLDVTKYSHILGKTSITVAIQSSRGCPFRCIFCDNRRTKFRARSAQNVLQELELLYNKGIRSFFFVDDNFVLDKKRLLMICEGMVAKKMKIDFKISSRVDLIDEEMMRALKRAGCSRISFGVESAQQKYLDYLEKGTAIEQIKKAFKIARKVRQPTFAYMMIGLRDQTKEEMYEQLEFLKKIKASYASFSVCSAYPRTSLYHNLLQDGTLKCDFWQKFAESPSKNFQMPPSSNLYSIEDIRQIQKELTQKFYLTPLFIVKTILRIRSLKQFCVLLKMFFRIITPNKKHSAKK